MPARLARGITGGSSARGWGVWQSFFVGRHFTGRDSSKVSVRPCARPCRRSSRPSVPSHLSQVALVEIAGRGVAVVGGVAVADRARHQHRHRGRGRLDRGAARHHRLTCRAVRGRPSARASPSRTRERLDGQTTRPASSRSRRIRPTSAFNRTDAESTAEVCGAFYGVLRAVSGEGAANVVYSRPMTPAEKKYFHPSRLRKHPAEGAICVCTF